MARASPRRHVTIVATAPTPNIAAEAPSLQHMAFLRFAGQRWHVLTPASIAPRRAGCDKNLFIRTKIQPYPFQSNVLKSGMAAGGIAADQLRFAIFSGSETGRVTDVRARRDMEVFI
ncbi:hypothetical protein STA1M1_21860 [Sinisalibacter aestuarii]|uniref:Uncharacterized protein n=1 Tax=Sinisalibacter aestuarii TaxID=2949426 RepID=A0ABQ5LTM4_9RHOB|nr:hypothetical protein STA1M1_21860 [Sinisalibacter aestuarii]